MSKEKDEKIKAIPIEYTMVDNISIAFCKPDDNKSRRSIAIWLPYLGGNRDTGKRELQMLAKQGFFALSIDPWLHGERKANSKHGVRSLVFKEFRAYMWQILGITTMDVFRVIDWAIDKFDLKDNVVVGGLSMGGDIAIALAGIDKRVSRVAAIASSTDWNRQGMTDVMDKNKIIDQGTPTNFGQWLYDTLNPSTNLKSFSRPIQFHIELGGLDSHIHPKWTTDFKEALCKEYSVTEKNFEIVINEDCNHLSLIQRKSIIDRAIKFMTEETQEIG